MTALGDGGTHRRMVMVTRTACLMRELVKRTLISDALSITESQAIEQADIPYCEKRH
jgi:hypothetical protein